MVGMGWESQGQKEERQVICDALYCNIHSDYVCLLIKTCNILRDIHYIALISTMKNAIALDHFPMYYTFHSNVYAAIHPLNGSTIAQIMFIYGCIFFQQGDEGFPGFPGPKVIRNTHFLY